MSLMTNRWNARWMWALMMIGFATPMTAIAADTTPLIPRDVLFGNPDKASVRISPDGKYLSWIAPVDGVLNVWVAPADNLDAGKPITNDRKRGIRSYSWTYNSQNLVYLQDEGGDENFHIYSVDMDTKKSIDLTPFKEVAATIENASPKFPDELLIGINDRDPQLHDTYRVNVKTGKRDLVFKNPGFAQVVTDDDYRVRFGMKMNPKDGSTEVFQPDEKGEWKPFDNIPMEDSLTTSPVDFDKSGESVYLLDSRGRDTAALVKFNPKTRASEVIASNEKADISDVMIHPITKVVEGVATTYEKTTWQFFDKGVEEDFRLIEKLAEGEVGVTSRTLDDRYWIASIIPDNGPVRYYLFDRKTKEAKFLFTNRKDLETVTLSKMHPVVIKARDGMNLVSYLTLPPGEGSAISAVPSKPLPMILDVHGGPWARDDWGLNPTHQWLANRGYAVLSVNFRGSTGFGKKFINAGNREWGARMHDDLLDAVKFAVDHKVADPSKIAIMGGSYGGYATLAGLTMTPDVFACGVDIVGPSNIVTLLKSVPPYWVPQLRMFIDRVGDHTTEEGRKFLESRSPLTHVANIKKPLLIGQGANDPRVKQAEADQIVQAMKAKKIPVTYVLYPDEGHGFARPANRLSFNAVTEAFLAEHLGGRFEPIGNAFEGASVTVPDGADQVPGLAAAIKAEKK